MPKVKQFNKEKVLEAASDIFRQKGYNGTSIDEILTTDAELPPQVGVIRRRRGGAPHELHSPGIAQACILVGVHRSSGGCRLSVSTTPAWYRYDL